MKIRKGDTVKILTGKDKGKTGKVLHILTKANKVSVEGLNLKYKHVRPKKGGEKGQRIMFPAAIPASNAMLVCPKCGQAARAGYKALSQKSDTNREKKQRICKKCNAVT